MFNFKPFELKNKWYGTSRFNQILVNKINYQP